MYDVIIIGGGIIGCATARELSRYDLKVLLVEKNSDIAAGATKANSGILHAGYDCHPGTLKAKLNVNGSNMYPELCKTLDIPYLINGSLVIAINESDLARLQTLYEQGIKNGVSGMELLSAKETLDLEPNLTSQVTGALRAKTAGIISPYEAGIAFAENAAVNGVEFMLETQATEIKPDGNGGYFVQFSNGDMFLTKIIINAAGVESANMSLRKDKIIPQRGQYFLLDNTQRDMVSHTIFPLPTNLGKGALIVPTVDGNILLGPTAEPPENPTATGTTANGLKDVLEKVSLLLKSVPIHDRITAYSGIRAKHSSKDFIIEETAPGFIDAIGIDSPGLTAAPAIAQCICEIVTTRLQPALNRNFVSNRIGIKRFRGLSISEQAALVKENPAYGRVVCRCETITEAEILQAIHRPLGAKNLDAMKRRTRAQMGRCQGGFCKLRLVELLSQGLCIPPADVSMDGVDSEVMPVQL